MKPEVKDDTQTTPVTGSEATPVVRKSGLRKKPPQEKKSDPVKGGGNVINIRGGEGINLMPTLSQEEIVVENKKTKFNYFGAVSILFLVLISVLIIGYNIVSQQTLRGEKEELAQLEAQVIANSDVLNANNQILDRFKLYQDIQSNTFSPKEVFLYLQDLTSQYGDINKIELREDLQFSFSGKASNLTEVSQLWHLLSVDEKVDSVTLKSVSKGEDSVSYIFDGQLDVSYFILRDQQQ